LLLIREYVINAKNFIAENAQMLQFSVKIKLKNAYTKTKFQNLKNNFYMIQNINANRKIAISQENIMMQLII
jgi:hypothetical protein